MEDGRIYNLAVIGQIRDISKPSPEQTARKKEAPKAARLAVAGLTTAGAVGAVEAALVTGMTSLPGQANASTEISKQPTTAPVPDSFSNPFQPTVVTPEGNTANIVVVPPTPTEKPKPADTEIPKPTPTPEAKLNLEQGLFKGIGEKLFKQALAKREQKAKEDPEYKQRINPEINQDTVNIVLLGSGSEDVEENIDATFVVSYNYKTNAVNLISLHREAEAPEIQDYIRKHPEAEKGKFNLHPEHRYELMRAMDMGGLPLVEKIVENTTGLSADYSMEFSIKAIKNFIDGVFETIEVDVPEDIEDDGSGFSFKKGLQKMNGDEAQYFMRTRKTSSVERRMSAQQIVLESTLNELIKRVGGNPIEQANLLLRIPAALIDMQKNKDLKTDIDYESLKSELEANKGDILTRATASKLTGGSFLQRPQIKRMVIGDGEFLVKLPAEVQGPRDSLRGYRDQSGKVLSAQTEGYYSLPRQKVAALIKS